MLERGGTGHRLSAISGDVLPIGTRRMEETVAEQEKDQKSERDFMSILELVSVCRVYACAYESDRSDGIAEMRAQHRP